MKPGPVSEQPSKHPEYISEERAIASAWGDHANESVWIDTIGRYG